MDRIFEFFGNAEYKDLLESAKRLKDFETTVGSEVTYTNLIQMFELFTEVRRASLALMEVFLQTFGPKHRDMELFDEQLKSVVDAADRSYKAVLNRYTLHGLGYHF